MIYLDNAATTEPKFHRDYTGFWLNSNTPYAKSEGEALGYAEAKIKGLLHVTGGQVLYFRCATEAIEWLFNLCGKWGDISCSHFSHDSIINANRKLNRVGEGTLYVDQFINPITGDTILECIKYNAVKNVFIGCDYTASIGHAILPKNPKYDFIFFSGHKFYCEKNVGAMWISDRLCEYLGATKDYRNQYGLVHGTVDVEGALMLADAMEWVNGNYEDSHYNNLLTLLYNLLFEAGIEAHNVCLNEKTRSHAINAIYLPNINADALQTYLASKDIYIGVAHSACADSDDYRILQVMGYSKDIARQTIRVSFGVDTTVENIREFVNAVKIFKEMF